MLDPKEAVRSHQELHANIAYHSFDEYMIELGRVGFRLMQRQDLKFDSKVSVVRTLKEGQKKPKVESDWLFERILATGKILVVRKEKNGELIEKEITIDQLEAWNPPKKTLGQRLGADAVRRRIGFSRSKK